MSKNVMSTLFGDIFVVTHPLLRKGEVVVIGCDIGAVDVRNHAGKVIRIYAGEQAEFQGMKSDLMIFDDLQQESNMHTQQQDGIVVEGADLNDVRRKLGDRSQAPYLSITPEPPGPWDETVTKERGVADKYPLSLWPTDRFRIRFHGRNSSFDEVIAGLDEVIKRVRPILRENVDAYKAVQKFTAEQLAEKKALRLRGLEDEKKRALADAKRVQALIDAES